MLNQNAWCKCLCGCAQNQWGDTVKETVARTGIAYDNTMPLKMYHMYTKSTHEKGKQIKNTYLLGMYILFSSVFQENSS